MSSCCPLFPCMKCGSQIYYGMKVEFYLELGEFNDMYVMSSSRNLIFCSSMCSSNFENVLALVDNLDYRKISKFDKILIVIKLTTSSNLNVIVLPQDKANQIWNNIINL